MPVPDYEPSRFRYIRKFCNLDKPMPSKDRLKDRHTPYKRPVTLYQCLPINHKMKFLVLLLFVAYVAADVSHLDGQAQIVSQQHDVNPDGSYQWSFETDNGISGRAIGSLDNPQSDEPSLSVQGGYEWTAPDGQRIVTQYVANKDGYQPQGDHLPIPPPIPDAIIRALEWIKAHPPAPERN